MASFVAQPLKCSNAEEESSGIVLSWMCDNQKGDVILPMLEKHGVADFDPEGWYPTQTLLNIARELYKVSDPYGAFVAIGKTFAEKMVSAADTPEEAIRAFNAAYGDVHRGFHPEQGLLIDRVEAGTLVVTNNTPWPGELIYGVLFSLGSRFKPGDKSKTTPIDPDEYLRAVFEVTWD